MIFKGGSPNVYYQKSSQKKFGNVPHFWFKKIIITLFASCHLLKQNQKWTRGYYWLLALQLTFNVRVCDCSIRVFWSSLKIRGVCTHASIKQKWRDSYSFVSETFSRSKYFIEQSHIHITNTITWTLGMSWQSCTVSGIIMDHRNIQVHKWLLSKAIHNTESEVRC